MKGLTLFLLLSGPLLGEGFICILMASPLFYLVGLIVGAVLDWSREKRRTNITYLLLILIPRIMSSEIFLPLWQARDPASTLKTAKAGAK